MLIETSDETPGTKEMIAEGGLPALTGSDADLPLAHEIRTRILVEADDVLTRLRSDAVITDAQTDTAIVSPRQVTPDQVHAAQAALGRLRGVTDADWWLAQRNRSASELLEEMMEEPGAAGQPS
ncbi:MAG TPA: hypothetical protein VKT77_10260 [Chthonomonadaceae bacterium]|nr:hypothetical protein [Chthonomonadaceae bacterium]